MNLELIKTYQTLIGAFLGSFLAIISSIALWWLKNYFEKRKQINDDKKEIENIFLMASRECHDSVNSLKKFVKKTKEIVDENSDNIVLALPSRFNKIYINQERLFLLSKNLHHIVSQQIDIAVYDAKEFNSWLDMYEKLPEVIYRNNMETIKLELKTKEEVIKEYLADLDNFVCNMGECIKNNVCVIQLRLLRPALALLHKDGELEKMMSDGVLDKKLEQEAINYLELNSLL